MIDYMENVTNVILLYANTFFDINFMNLLLLNFTPTPVVRNDTLLLPILFLPSLARI